MSKLFNPYRYFIMLEENNETFFSQSQGPYPYIHKERIIYDFFNKIKSSGYPFEFSFCDKTYHIVHRGQFGKYNLIKLSISTLKTVHKLLTDDIKSDSIDDNPYVFVIIDTSNQILLIQHDPDVFRQTKTAAKALCEAMNNFTHEYMYEIAVNPMLTREDFWNIVDNNDIVTSVEFELESPNLFEGIIEVSELLKKLRQLYNNTKTKIKLYNRNKSLTLKKDNKELESTIDYASAGGGKWIMTYINQLGKKKAASSDANIQKIVVEEDVEELFRLEAGADHIFGQIKDESKNDKERKERK